MSNQLRGSSVRLGVVVALAAAARLSAAAETVRESESVQEFVVTGTRVGERLRLDTLSPVDVISVNGFAQESSTELSALLSKAAPSYNFPRPSIADGSDTVRPGTLRG